MVLFCKTRQQMRDIVARRKAAGWPAKGIDMGKDAQKRYAVALRG